MSPAWTPERAHDDLPLLPPSVELETKEVFRTCIRARAALGELKQASELILNPSMLINTLPILEAQASTEIENIVTTTGEIFRHLNDDKTADPATKEALRHRLALLDGLNSLRERPLCTATAEFVCSRIQGRELRVRKVPGTALANAATGEVIYTPPQAEARLRRLLANWETFLHTSEPFDPLIRMAVAHYQFEAIHPFSDGNGRTGRVLNSLYLVEHELLTMPILHLSRYILKNRSAYYSGLLEVTRSAAWEPWIIFILKGIEETATWTLQKIKAVRQLVDETAQFTSRTLPKIHSRELIELLFRQPYCRISQVVDAGIAKRQTASTYLKQLCAQGVLLEQVSGREKLFLNARLLEALGSEEHRYRPLP
jgi:cell filamentation protein, protein adenylyltransferase